MSLAPPGVCQFREDNDDFVSVPLLHRWRVSETSYVLRFGLPDPSKPLNLSTCACILAKADIGGNKNDEPVVRPYTPISTNQQIGSFDLLVKNYGDAGLMSRYLCEGLQEGSVDGQVGFKHIGFNVKIQAPFTSLRRIGMLVGGTGITPMIQALHAILGDPKDVTTEVDMLYGSKVASDILGKELLDHWSDHSHDRFRVNHVLSDESSPAWTGLKGHIDETLIARHMPDPNDERAMIFVCGPPPMYQALCGPRDEPDQLSGILADMGYNASQVYKF